MKAKNKDKDKGKAKEETLSLFLTTTMAPFTILHYVHIYSGVTSNSRYVRA